MRSLTRLLLSLGLLRVAAAQATITVTRTEVAPGATSSSATPSTSATTSSAPLTTTPATTGGAASPSITAVSDCHIHELTQFCMAGTAEFQVLIEVSATTSLPAQYTGCHSHDSEFFCVAPNGEDVQLREAADEHDPETTPAPTSTGGAAAAEPSVTAVSDCHLHDTVQFCVAGTAEYQVLLEGTATTELPAQYTGCHAHESELFCIAPDGSEVELLQEGAEEDEHGHEHEDEHGDAHGAEESSSGSNCHFHAGVEHCVGGDAEASCERVDRDYNIPLRIGLLFVILATSSLGAFGPIFLTALTRLKTNHIIFSILKQFGTGIIISTAFVHLYTHATLMFENECLGELSYESTTGAIVMAGLLISFLIEYAGHRFLHWQTGKRTTAEAGVTSEEVRAKGDATSAPSELSLPENANVMNVMILEAGILFHSVLIGLTLVVAGDSFFLTLFAVILFHQMFEGIALGTRIAELPSSRTSFVKKLVMAGTFAISTPLGMAIGIGVLSSYNGNDPSTVIAVGTLDAFSAGILIWVGVVEMWAEDWLHGDMKSASLPRTLFGLTALIVGMIAMSVLGKWA